MTFPFPVHVPDAAGQTFTFYDSATSSSANVTAPADINAGDLLIYCDMVGAVSGGPPTAVTPTGFTNISNEAHDLTPYGGSRTMVSWKTAAGTEGGTSIGGMSGFSMTKLLGVWRGSPSAYSSLASQSIASQGTTGNPTAQNITSSGGSVPLLVIGFYCEASSSGNVNPRTMSVTADGEISNGTIMYVKYKAYASSPVDVSVDMDDEGSFNVLCSFYIEGTV